MRSGIKQSVVAGQHSFAQVPQVNHQRSAFDRSTGHKTTFNAGLLVPVFVDEVLPGDTMNLSPSFFARLATPLHPLMDNMWLEWFFFAVPYRLVWDNWEKFNGAQTDPGDSTDYLIPQLTSPPSTGWTQGTLADYFGIPILAPDLPHSALPFRAYNLIWNEWYRDQNLQDSLTVPTDDGPDSTATYTVKRRGKRHDYFTSCLPWPQKGPSVDLPLGTTAPVTLDLAQSFGAVGDGSAPVFHMGDPGATLGTLTRAAGALPTSWSASPATPAGTTSPTWSDPHLDTDIGGATGVADLSAATSATINQLRQAMQIQGLYERDARGGTRYTETIRVHFGVTSPDQRLQRPEYLGGGSTMINLSAVPQTSSTDATTPQGNLAAYGIAGANGRGFAKSFTEHCIVIGLVNVRADLNYQQGLDRMWSRRTRWDFYWPSLARIGEQAVLNKEIYARGSLASTDDEVFGYQERYAEYRYKPSLITGALRSDYGLTLDTWHLAQDFTSLPVLGDTFIQDNPPIARVIAQPTAPHFLFDSYFKYTHVRPMPTYGVPGSMDRF